MNHKPENRRLHKARLEKPRVNIVLLVTGLLVVVLLIVLWALGVIKLTNSQPVCGDLMGNLRIAADAREISGYEDEGAYVDLLTKVDSMDPNGQDATCSYIKLICYYDTNRYDEAFFQAQALKKLYDSGKTVDNRGVEIKDLETISEHIVYFKAMKIQSSQED